MKMKSLKELVRPNILRLKPYSCARNEFTGHAEVFLDANEIPYNSPYNRYPDPLQRELKAKLSTVKGVPEECIFLGNGSDEAIDLSFRIFCEPGIDNVVAIEPTYGMYLVSAEINNVGYRTVELEKDFSFKADKLLKATDEHTKLIFLCTPNNPTGNMLPREEVVKVLETFDGIVIIDEAYSDFTRQKTFRSELAKYPNMIVLNTFSKAWGSAGIRVGMAFASSEIISYFNNVKYPYNINELAQREALAVVARSFDVDKWVNIILGERLRLMDSVSILPYCKKVFPTDANFFLVRFENAQSVYDYLVECGVIVRNRSNVTLCNNCLRITVGSPAENTQLLAAMRKYSAKARL